MGLISCSLSEEYLSDRSYVTSLKSEVAALGSGWQELELLACNLDAVPEQAGVFLLLFKDSISNNDASIYTKNVIFIGGDEGRNLRYCFSELLSIFESKSITHNAYSVDILKFDVRRQDGDLLFVFMEIESISSELIKVITKLRRSYSPIGNRVPTGTLDHSKIEPAF